MNVRKLDILRTQLSGCCKNQRELAALSGYSLGAVNASVRELRAEGLLDSFMQPTPAAISRSSAFSPRRAVILAAGSGRRMTPIHLNTSKAFLEVDGKALIERLICQLHDVGIREIYIVVGFLMEQFEYLMDKYQVELIVNPEYEDKNNLYSVSRALPYLSDAYLLPCDIWCRENPFRKHELYSWYMVTDQLTGDSNVRINRKSELVEAENGNNLIGISYFTEEDAEHLRQRIREMIASGKYERDFWEEALLENHRMFVHGRLVSSQDVVELNTYEQLRKLDAHSRQLQSSVLKAAANVLGAKPEEICGISALKDGVTNRSFVFTCRDKKYIMRIPQNDSQEYVDRAQEKEAYRIIEPWKISDRVLYINQRTGWKLAEFMEDARTCDPQNPSDIIKCMTALRKFHDLGLKTSYRTDLFEWIIRFEKLRKGPSAYRDYTDTKEHVMSLKPYIDAHIERKVLTHMDAIPDNFLLVRNEAGEEQVRLIDWECASMQDPHMDLAMFCVYSLYDRPQVDALIDAYFPEGCKKETRIKIYCYISVCGLFWSNWCEYKRKNGVRFGEYSLRQYRYAKDYYRIAEEEMRK